MTKAPAFQFYAADFLIGTMGMTYEERGIYMTMLSLQWDIGMLPASDKELRGLLALRKVIPAKVLAKFVKLPCGNLQNARLEKERNKQAAFRESRAANAAKRWNEKPCTSNARASTVHGGSTCKTDALQSSSTSTSSEFSPGGEVARAHNSPRVSFVPPTLDEVTNHATEKEFSISEATRFWNNQESKGWKVGMAPMKSWKPALANWCSGRFIGGNSVGGHTASPTRQPASLDFDKPEERPWADPAADALAALERERQANGTA